MPVCAWLRIISDTRPSMPCSDILVLIVSRIRWRTPRPPMPAAALIRSTAFIETACNGL
jgi:hypothetical protein